MDTISGLNSEAEDLLEATPTGAMAAVPTEGFLAMGGFSSEASQGIRRASEGGARMAEVKDEVESLGDFFGATAAGFPE